MNFYVCWILVLLFDKSMYGDGILILYIPSEYCTFFLKEKYYIQQQIFHKKCPYWQCNSAIVGFAQQCNLVFCKKCILGLISQGGRIALKISLRGCKLEKFLITGHHGTPWWRGAISPLNFIITLPLLHWICLIHRYGYNKEVHGLISLSVLVMCVTLYCAVH